jgi:hypothetical protein
MNIYTNKNIFYVYAYLRSKDSQTAPKGTPYYIGKGSNGRAYDKRRSVPAPKDKSNIIFIGINMGEYKAFEMEKFLIAYYGRIDLGTGILRNRTDGGEGMSGYITTEAAKSKISSANKGKNHPMYGKTGENNPRYGQHHSVESKAKLSAAQKGEKSHLYGKLLSDKHKAKISATKLNMPMVKCPHCGKQGRGSAMKQWHFDNCRLLDLAGIRGVEPR